MTYRADVNPVPTESSGNCHGFNWIPDLEGNVSRVEET